jgi:glycosyltransferase involved in cell wall biosynthesis
MQQKQKIALLSTPGSINWIGGLNYMKSILYALNSLGEKRNTFELYMIFNGSEEKKLYEDILDLLDGYYQLDVDGKPFTFANKIKWLLQRKFSNILNPRLHELLVAKNITATYPIQFYKGGSQPIYNPVWLADFQFKHYPEDSKTEFAGLNEVYQLAVSHAPRLVLSSYEVEKDCFKFFPDSKGKTFVYQFKVHLPEAAFELKPQEIANLYHLPEKYLIVCNMLSPNKQYDLIIAAVELLKKQGSLVNIICTGSLFDYRNPHYINEILKKVHQLGVHEQIRFLGIIPRLHQINLVRNSLAVIQPSKFEGWNTSVEEAKLLGKQLILSNIDVHVEQNPSDALFFDTNNAEDLSKQLLRVWQNSDKNNNFKSGFDIKKEDIAKEKYHKETQMAGELFLKLMTKE